MVGAVDSEVAEREDLVDAETQLQDGPRWLGPDTSEQ
jgi:hypothetical protein